MKIAQMKKLIKERSLQDSIKILNDREKEILHSRNFTDRPVTLKI